MFEDKTFENLLNKKLESPLLNSLDKKEGSLVYSTLAPNSKEVSELYSDLEYIKDCSFIFSATGEFLDRKVAELGYSRIKSTKSLRLVKFYDRNSTLADAPIGTRLGCDNSTYITISKLDVGIFVCECEQEGFSGNIPVGKILGLTPTNIAYGELEDIVKPSRDTETDDELRERVKQLIIKKPFGGNKGDYLRYLSNFEDVGACAIYTSNDTGIPQEVKLYLMGTDSKPLSQTRCSEIKEILDPGDSHSGEGVVPIGHKVLVSPAVELLLSISVVVRVQSNISNGLILDTVNNLFVDLNKKFGSNRHLRITSIISSLIDLPNVVDVPYNSITINSYYRDLLIEKSQVLPKSALYSISQEVV